MNEYLEEFWNAWEDLANRPTDLSARAVVKAKGEVICDMFNNLGGELTKLRTSKSDDVSAMVTEVNRLISEIYNANQEILKNELGSGGKANDSRDKRDLALKQLSEYIDVDAIEDERGAVTVISGGNLLVSGVSLQQIGTTTSILSLDDGTKIKEVGLKVQESGKEFIPVNGSLKGAMDARDIVIKKYQDMLDEFSQKIVEEVNQQHKNGYNLDGNTGLLFFNNQMETGGEIITLGATGMRIDASVKSNLNNIAAARGDSLTEATTQYNFSGGNALFDIANPGPPVVYSTKWGYMDKDAPPSSIDQERRNIEIGSVTAVAVDLPKLAGEEGYPGIGRTLTEGVDYVVNYDDGQIMMLDSTLAGERIEINYNYSTGGSAGKGDGNNARAISRLRNSEVLNEDSAGNPSATFGEYYSAMIGELGVERNEAEASKESREFLIEQYQNRQEEIAGVSLDEELANLVKFEHSYQASARMISTVDRMLEILMNI